MVRAKFTVREKQPQESGGTVSLYPVVSGSEENERFYHLTPGGSVILSTINSAAFDAFEVGKDYYVDFTPAIPAVDAGWEPNDNV